MTGATYDYGRSGIVGIGTPQANPTVEAEMAILLPPSIARVTTRLVSGAADSLARLRAYLENVDEALVRFDTLRPNLFAFACTGPSYLVDPQAEAEIVRNVERRFGYPMLTATEAIARTLARLEAKRIFLLTPYPPGLTEAAGRYWQTRGLALTGIARVETGSADTRSIYTLGSGAGRAALARCEPDSADIVLVSGTGMPTLSLIADPPPGPRIISSNYCLAAAICTELGCGDLETPAASAAWQARLKAAMVARGGA